jgi:hypothetical protein
MLNRREFLAAPVVKLALPIGAINREIALDITVALSRPANGDAFATIWCSAEDCSIQRRFR